MTASASGVRLREADADDLPLVRETIVRAMQWDPGRVLPPPEHLLIHPELVRFHQDWAAQAISARLPSSTARPSAWPSADSSLTTTTVKATSMR